jgi:hypothetical protein
MVFFPDCGPHRTAVQCPKRQQNRCNGKWSEDCVNVLRRQDENVVQTAATAIVSTAAHLCRSHGSNYLPNHTAWAAACQAAGGRRTASAQTGSPRPSGRNRHCHGNRSFVDYNLNAYVSRCGCLLSGARARPNSQCNCNRGPLIGSKDAQKRIQPHLP